MQKGWGAQHGAHMKNATRENRLSLSRITLKRLVGLTLILAGMSLVIEGVRAVMLQ